MKCKSKRYYFWQNTINEIEKSLEDPNTFWIKIQIHFGKNGIV